MATMPPVLVADEAPGIVASPERIAAWMAVAKSGDRFVYATRLCLPVASSGARRMRELADRGLVYLTRPRSSVDASMFNYTAERSSRPTPLTRPDRTRLVAAAKSIADGEAAAIDALLPVLERFARAGRPCPTDRQLGQRADLPEAAIRSTLEAMVASHLIRVQGAAPPTYRRIIILASGAITGIAA